MLDPEKVRRFWYVSTTSKFYLENYEKKLE